jgi:hypothetical protein
MLLLKTAHARSTFILQPLFLFGSLKHVEFGLSDFYRDPFGFFCVHGL